MRRALVVALLLLPLPALAQEPSPSPSPSPTPAPWEQPTVDPAEVRAAAKSGIDAYVAGDYDKALGLLQHAASTIDKLQLPEQVTVRKYLAYTFVAFDRFDEARSQFESALALDPSLSLPDGTSPKIAQVFADAKKELASEAAAAGGTRVVDPHPVVTPHPPVISIVGIRGGDFIPSTHSFHDGPNGYGIGLVAMHPEGDNVISLAGSYAGAQSRVPTNWNFYDVQLGFSRYLLHGFGGDEFLEGGVGYAFGSMKQQDVDSTEGIHGGELFGGAGATFFRRSNLALRFSARWMFLSSGGAVENGPAFAIDLLYDRPSRYGAGCCM